ncbi:pyridoxamine 5'-phosphate oxidase family protein [Streptomyces sp. NPDC006134]|uniref:pyridoxamine 5'-phosphate oxidase family protein n=1 Tax=Streptomyces sp. NPDC006134 TaxID=3154467 RepID=UPI0033C2D7EC
MVDRSITARRIRFSRKNGTFGSFDGAQFDVEKFLSRALVGRLAMNGPVVRPFWFVWEEEAFWMITGAWSVLDERLLADPSIELVIDTCDLETGETLQVIGHGRGYVVDFDVERGRRILTKYAGPDEDHWDARFRLRPDPSVYGTRLAKLVPDDIWTVDLSFVPAPVARQRDTGAAGTGRRP